MPGPVLDVDHVAFAYSSVGVLHGATLSVAEGEVLSLVGPNGAGKTTLLRVVAGLERQTSGSIHLAGEDLSRLPTEERVRRGLGVVFGGEAVFGDLTVDANLQASGQLLRGQPGVLAERVAEVYDIFPRLRERRRAQAVQLSGGEQQMLALGKAFLLRPKVLCIDEMSLGLAPVLVARLIDVIRRFRDSGVTILLVEQSLHVAAEVSDRVAFFERGEVRHTQPAEDLRRTPA